MSSEQSMAINDSREPSVTEAPVSLSPKAAPASADVTVRGVFPGEYRAVIKLSGWGGYGEQPVIIIGATPKKFRIRAIERTKLAGRHRWLNVGEIALVPKYAVKFEQVTA